MIKNPGDGIYQSRANWFKQTTWPVERQVYIQGKTVRLVNATPEPGLSIEVNLFNFDHWFEANDLGERLGDLPANFNIRAYQYAN